MLPLYESKLLTTLTKFMLLILCVRVVFKREVFEAIYWLRPLEPLNRNYCYSFTKSFIIIIYILAFNTEELFPFITSSLLAKIKFNISRLPSAEAFPIYKIIWPKESPEHIVYNFSTTF